MAGRYAVKPVGVSVTVNKDGEPEQVVVRPGLYAALRAVYSLACQHPERVTDHNTDAINVVGKFIDGLSVTKGGVCFKCGSTQNLVAAGPIESMRLACAKCIEAAKP